MENWKNLHFRTAAVPAQFSQHRKISGTKIIFFHLVHSDPIECLTFHRFGFPIDMAAPVTKQQYLQVRVAVQHHLINVPNFHCQPQLFFDLPPQALLRLLTGFQLPPGELPIQGPVTVRRPLDNKNFTILFNNTGRNDNHINPLPTRK